jgi:hypothetical protein
MGLHDALNPGTIWIWKWYEAYVERRGRAHLLYVPFVKREWIAPPSWLNSEANRDEYIRREQRRGEVWSSPSFIYPDAPIQRACKKPQRVQHWAQMNWSARWTEWHMPIRGICNECYLFAKSFNPDKIGNPPLHMGDKTIESRGSGVYDDTVMATWIREAQGYVDG